MPPPSVLSTDPSVVFQSKAYSRVKAKDATVNAKTTRVACRSGRTTPAYTVVNTSMSNHTRPSKKISAKEIATSATTDATPPDLGVPICNRENGLFTMTIAKIAANKATPARLSISRAGSGCWSSRFAVGSANATSQMIPRVRRPHHASRVLHCAWPPASSSRMLIGRSHFSCACVVPARVALAFQRSADNVEAEVLTSEKDPCPASRRHRSTRWRRHSSERPLLLRAERTRRAEGEDRPIDHQPLDGIRHRRS